MRECLITAAIVLLVTPRLWAGATTPFTLGEQGGVIVPVKIGEAGPFMMLLDTGATHSAIVERVAATLGARMVAKSMVLSPTDRTIRPVVAVEDLAIGPMTVDALLPSVVADGAFDREASIQGLIGQDVLAVRRYTVDFKRRLIEWHDGAPAHRGVALPLAFESGRYLVNVSNGGTTLRLVPDSGAGALVLYRSAGAGVGIIDAGVAALSSATATVRARRVIVRELRLGSRVLRDLVAVALDDPGRLPAEGDGLLPLQLFDRVTFDGPARLLVLS